jgi:small subunit ribosomal protein S9
MENTKGTSKTKKATTSTAASAAASTVKKAAAPKKKAAAKAKPKKAKAGSPVVSHGVGRRKSSVARVWLRRGKGDINVNGKKFADYFDIDFNRDQAALVFDTMQVVNYDADVNVYGGGVNSQAQAVKLGIARALVEHDAELKTAMRPYHFLSCDSRVKERKKFGQKAARRKFQFVKR